MLAVLEHLHNPLAMLKEISRVLVPEGRCIITVPSHLAKPVLEFLAYRLHIVSKEEILDHKRYYNKRDMRELVAQVEGMRIIRHRYFQCGMNNIVILEKHA